MPAHNASATIEAAIASVQAQTYTDWELIVSDDASIDNTPNILRRYAESDPRLRALLHPSHIGVGRARNEAIKTANGRFIAFLDSDDLWLPEKLSVQIPFMLQRSVALCYSSYERFSPGDGPDGPRRLVIAPTTLTYAELLRQNLIGTLTAVYDRDMTGTVSFPELARFQDYATWLSILRNGHTACGIDQPLALYRVSSAASHTKKRLRSIYYAWKVYREAENLPRSSSAYYLTTCAIGGLRKGR